MMDIYLISYSVKGIKTIDQLVTLSFYKKTITRDLNIQDYNVKGIYGMNGTGKSGIMASVDILKNLLTDPGYLNNPLVQKNLDAMINKKTGKLFIRAEYIVGLGGDPMLFRYEVTLVQEASGKYVISEEELASKKATSKRSSMETLFKASGGELVVLKGNRKSDFLNEVKKRTINLLSSASMSALIYENRMSNAILLYSAYIRLMSKQETVLGDSFTSLILLRRFGEKLYVYLDASDEHKDYLISSFSDSMCGRETNQPDHNHAFRKFAEADSSYLDLITVSGNRIYKTQYGNFEKATGQLCEFLQIFKPDLKAVEIDKKEDYDIYVCSLIMAYDSYKIHAEFESTGIKKLIRLFAYLKAMVSGGIVFIDEFDSNLHDVYLCALLEYLMEYGKGQLCFTTHNVGPMDILRHHKKSIDFLSEDHKIYPWVTNGNYSPSKLYRNGMIEGSPFNIDSTDFIGVFSSDREDA